MCLFRANGNIFSVPQKNIIVSGICPGDIVSLSFKKGEELVNSSISKIRTDISWDELILKENNENNNSNNNFNNSDNNNEEEEIEREKEIEKERGNEIMRRHWTDATMKKFLENVAKNFGMDPLLPETWYSITPTKIYQFKVIFLLSK